jgi:hypothetical protein
VTGVHAHEWESNREQCRKSGFGDLPFRTQLPAQIRRLPQALAELAAKTRLNLGDHGRDFDVPPRTDLFE